MDILIDWGKCTSVKYFPGVWPNLFVYFKGALDNILKFYFWLNFIYHVKCNC